ncbi:MAG: SOS response-associated peptidase [Leptolyngbya sp. SIO4C1]|nr:SOS response-associated peptidase [Leptolyngbya sp. SIO4C1]
MCGRFTQTQSSEAIAAAFQLQTVPQSQPRYNIAPSQPVAAAIQTNHRREYRIFQWGLVPSWAKDPSIGNRLINARAETAAEKPSFRNAFKRRRCLIIADGFYEWQRGKGVQQKQPYYIQLKDRSLFSFAGLWEQWERGDGSYLETCTILTTEPNSLLQPIHNRMPVILPPQTYDTWLDPRLQGGRQVQRLLLPYAADAMQAYPVSTLINNPRNEDPACIKSTEENS